MSETCSLGRFPRGHLCPHCQPEPSHNKRVLADGCRACGFSKVYCDCVIYIDGSPCCATCSH